MVENLINLCNCSWFITDFSSKASSLHNFFLLIRKMIRSVTQNPNRDPIREFVIRCTTNNYLCNFDN